MQGSSRHSGKKRKVSQHGNRGVLLAALPRVAIEPIEPRLLFDGVPQAGIDVSDITTAGASTVTVTVTYTDDKAIARTSVGASDVTVVNEAGGPALVLTQVLAFPENSTTPIVATYTFAAPGGSWDASDNGSYRVNIEKDRVFDQEGNSVDPTTTTFKVDIGGSGGGGDGGGDDGEGDGHAPEAKLKDPADVHDAGAGSVTFTVTYEDDNGIDTNSIGTNDLAITGGSIGSDLTVTNVQFDVQKRGEKVVAVYTAVPPGGTWDAADNGTYTATVRFHSVLDVSGLPVEGDAKQFHVDIPVSPPPVSPPPVSPPPVSPPPPPVNSAPVAAISPPNDISQAGGGSQKITVIYSDDGAINPGTIGADDITVQGPAGPLAVTDVTVSGSGGQYTATYTVAAPGAGWDSADVGSYTFSVQAGAVQDDQGAGSTPAIGSFEVTITPEQPVIDPTFSGGTLVSSGFVAEAAVTLEDGRIVLAGRQGNLSNGTSQEVIKRLNPDGSPDSTFGFNGVVASTIGDNQAAYAVALRDDGSLITAGTLNGDIVVSCYKPSGGLDPRFGHGGRMTYALPTSTDAAYSVAIGLGNSIVVGGTSNNSFAFVRFTANGAVDTFFGDQGLSLFAMGTGPNAVGGLAIQSDGKILAAGSAGDGVALLRLQPDGSEDLSFGNGGAVSVTGVATRNDLGDPDRTLGMALQPDGKVLVTNRGNGDFAVARLNADGSTDTSFASGGLATVDFGGDDDADAIVVQGTGEILVVGTTTAGGSPRTAVAALNPDGAPDARFGNGGKFTIENGVSDPGRALHAGDLVLRAFASARGDQLVVGASNGSVNATSSSALRRLNVPGSGLLGRFGAVNGKTRKLRFVDGDGTVVTLSLKSGTGQAFYDGSNVDLVLTGTTVSSVLAIKTKGGDGRLRIRNLAADLSLKTLNAKSSDVTGTIWVGGDLGNAVIGNLTGTVAAAGSIASLAIVGNLNGGKVLAGANLGADHQPGGIGANVDTFQAGSIRKIKVAGGVTTSLFAAGVDPKNGAYLDSNDVVVGGVASQILSVNIKGGVDADTHFIAGAFGAAAKLPQKVKTAEDVRFVLK